MGDFDINSALVAASRSRAAEVSAKSRGRGRRNRQKRDAEDEGNGLEKDVVAGDWLFASCRAQPGVANADVPDSFDSATQYAATFRSLVVEEARAGMVSAAMAAIDTGSAQQAGVFLDRELPGGGARLLVLGLPDSWREGNLVVLTSAESPSPAVLEDPGDAPVAAGGEGRAVKRARTGDGSHAPGALTVAGILRARRRDGGPGREGRVCEVDAFPTCRAAPGCGGRCSAVLSGLLGLPRAERSVAPAPPPAQWWALPGGSVVVQSRELGALSALSSMPLRGPLLRPQLLRHYSAGSWPRHFHSAAFHAHLHASFDSSQLAALEACMGVLGAEERGERSRPIVLVKGPPGTGKTHTVRGILNAWHLVGYQQHYASLEAAILASLDRDGWGAGMDPVELLLDVDHMLETGEGLAPLPRILVCAPSNAAIDELLGRVLTDGFRDLTGARYDPKVVRVGPSDSPKISPASLRVFVDTHVARLLAHTPETFEAEAASEASFLSDLSRAIAALKVQFPAATPTHRKALAEQLAREYHRRERHVLRMEMLECVRGKVYGMPGRQERAAVDGLEALWMRDAQIVFTTLSSAARASFARSKAAFRRVLIDEACQASEPAALQALMYGCEHCVLVGDPQQLPATLISQTGRASNFQRSLFERLTVAGCPVSMLSVQYRMHPEIRSFPSRHFYDGKLTDGACVVAAPDEVFYGLPPLGPYAFFDVPGGREDRRGGGSLMNAAEGRVVLSLLSLLSQAVRARLAAGTSLSRPYQVAVITPYREQKAHLSRLLASRRGDVGLPAFDPAHIAIDTVDSFQGKQVDVVIMSCVRTDPSGRIGFVADVRRLNVSITRAKRALWIVGSCQALEASNATWKALIDDARGRQCFHSPHTCPEVYA